jgi:hypothetical protein
MLQVIPIPPAGYTVPTLKDALGQAIAYIRLLQKNLILSACLSDNLILSASSLISKIWRTVMNSGH